MKSGVNLRSAALSPILLAAALRIIPLTQNRFHPDEALYASFARLIASGQDPLLSTQVVDKPPLSFYLMAASMALVGPHEISARLPNLFASIISVALVYAAAKQMYARTEAGLAALAFALSPLAILFSITAFTDPLATALTLAAWVAALRGRWGWTGAWLGLGFAAKQSTLAAVPLLALTGLVKPASKHTWRAAGAFALALAPFVASSFLWDALRQGPIGFWQQGFSDNSPGRFIRANEIGPRFHEWARLLAYLTGSRVVNAGLAIGLPALLVRALTQRSRAAAFDLALATYVFAYLGAYWLLAFNVWDRYLLTLAPLLCLLLARLLASALPPPRSYIAASLLTLLLLPPALTASRSGYPIGGDHGAYDGIEQAAAYLRRAPPGSVLYDYWLSWEWKYYLFDAPVYVAWFPGPAALAADLQAFGRSSPRYFVTPSWESDSEIRQAVRRTGFEMALRLTTHRRDGSPSFAVYEFVASP